MSHKTYFGKMRESPQQVATAAGKWKHGGGSLSRHFRGRPGAALDLIGGVIAWGARTHNLAAGAVVC
jgi:hypothetical protein